MYPTEPPEAKFDVLSPRLPVERTLQEALGLDSTAAIFQALDQDPPKDLKMLSTVYVYPSDSPKPPVPRSIVVIGFASLSAKLVRHSIGYGDGELPSCVIHSTVAVRRADGAHSQSLDEARLQNSRVFSKLMRRMQSEQVVAILAADKFGRFGVLAPSLELKEGSECSSHDFYANLYLGKIESVKRDLAESSNDASEKIQDENIGSLWVPPGAAPESESNNLWQPSSTSDDNPGGSFWQPPSSDIAEPFAFGPTGTTSIEPSINMSNKRKLDEFHGDAGAAAADAFYSSLTRTLETRADSRIYHLRAFNGWVKATQIQELNPKTKTNRDGPLRILDLACGKGGDLGKWTIHTRGVKNYVGSDVARGSLKDAAIRARKMRNKLKRCTFTCADLGADVPGRLKGPNHKQMQKLLTWSLQKEPLTERNDPVFQMIRGGGISLDDHFDVVSIQFAIHYMMSSKKRARRFFQTVGELLDIGGNLIVTTIDARRVIWHLMNLGLNLHFDGKNVLEDEVVIDVGKGACKLRFEPQIVQRIFSLRDSDPVSEDMFGLEYSFTLVEGDDHSQGVGDAVNLPEWLTPIPVLSALAKEAGLELESAENFHEFYSARSNPLLFAAAHSSMYNMKVLNRNGTIAADEWEISGMYVALKFRKVRESTMQVEESDEEDQGDNDGESNGPGKSAEIDPALKAKFMPLALMKAKKSVGNDVWLALSSDEKSRLTEVELIKVVEDASN